ncbi:MAG: sensor histidine kinase [Herbaspirillum sp.]
MSKIDLSLTTVDAPSAAYDALAAQMLAVTSELVIANQHLQSEISERQHVEQLLQESQRLLQHLLADQERIKEHERKRIAREIHDELAQNLLSLRLDVVHLQTRTAGSHPVLHDRSSVALNQIDLSMKSVRNIINNLHPAVLDLGLQAAVEWQVQEFRRRSGIACELNVEPSPELSAESNLESGSESGFSTNGLSEDRALAIFRIVQESLNNITRHAQATHVKVQLQAESSRLSLKITDNGIGMDLNGQPNSNSFGLISMRERVDGLQGRLEIISAPKQGTMLTVTVPLILDAAGS